MIRFDKFKIIAPMNAIDGYKDNPCFETTIKGDEILRYKFNYNRPSLHVIVSPSEFKVSVEFSGKILGENYPHLINIDTITECIARINALGLFRLDPNLIIDEGIVGQCDVTCDLDGIETDKLVEVLRNHLSSPKWIIETYGGGIVIRKTVKTTKYQRRLSVYNKEAEMQKQSNLDFLGELENRKEIVDYFEGKTRLELNLNSMQAIRDALGIESNSVRSVLTATSNPIRETFLASIKLSDTEKEVKTLKDFERSIVLEQFDYDLNIIRDRISKFFKNRNGVNKVIAVYRELAQTIQPTDYSWLYGILDQAA